MVREVKLIEHLPQFIQEYREIKQIMKAENSELQFLNNELEVILNNQFILGCDLNAIKRFERLLRITASDEDSLDLRISRVMIKWNDFVPYTWKVIFIKLINLCGENFEVITDFDNFAITIITHLDVYGQVDELQNLFDYMIPANISITSKNELNHNINCTLFLTMGIAFCQIFELTETFKENFKFDANAKLGATMIGTAEVTITDVSKKNYTIQGSQNFGSAVSYSKNIDI